MQTLIIAILAQVARAIYTLRLYVREREKGETFFVFAEKEFRRKNEEKKESRSILGQDVGAAYICGSDVLWRRNRALGEKCGREEKRSRRREKGSFRGPRGRKTRGPLFLPATRNHSQRARHIGRRELKKWPSLQSSKHILGGCRYLRAELPRGVLCVGARACTCTYRTTSRGRRDQHDRARDITAHD